MSEVEHWLRDLLPQPGTGLALDVGANAGNWTVAMAERCTEVHAFEPNPQCHMMLLGHLAGRQNVRVLEVAVGDDIGDTALHLYPHHSHASAYHGDDLDTLTRGDHVETVKVPLVSLDALGYWVRPVDYIKIDTEGAEVDVVKGARDTLFCWRPSLLIECHTAGNRDWLLENLPSVGYQPEHLPHPHRGVPEGHCWIVAPRPSEET